MKTSEKLLRCIKPLVMFCLGLIPVTPAKAELIGLNPLVINCAEDIGPQDGIFDSWGPLNVCSINNNGYTSFRMAMEFDLSGLPAHITIRSATLILSVAYVEGTRSIALHGYPGDGQLWLPDFSSNGPINSVVLESPGPGIFALDSTVFMQGLVARGDRFAGYNLREEPANTMNYTLIFFGTGGPAVPQLLVDFDPIAPPDADGDGIPDAIDACPGTSPGAVVDATGCSIEQLVPCEGPRTGGQWRSHGAYVSAMVKVAKAFSKAGLISHQRAVQYIQTAARSHCGK